MGLLNVDAHRPHIHGLLDRGNHDIDPALVRAKAVPGGVTGEVGIENETRIVNVDFLTHKYQSPYL